MNASGPIDDTSDSQRALGALVEAVAALREQLTAANARADADAATIAILRAALEAARAQAQASTQALAEQDRANAARRSLGLWQRIWRAARGA